MTDIERIARAMDAANAAYARQHHRIEQVGWDALGLHGQETLLRMARAALEEFAAVTGNWDVRIAVQAVLDRERVG